MAVPARAGCECIYKWRGRYWPRDLTQGWFTPTETLQETLKRYTEFTAITSATTDMYSTELSAKRLLEFLWIPEPLSEPRQIYIKNQPWIVEGSQMREIKESEQ